jgi:hypothetical protein
MEAREAQGSERRGIIERGLRWDVGFNRRLGVVALLAAGGVTIAGAPVIGAKIAMFAGASFAGAEISNRLARSLENKRASR